MKFKAGDYITGDQYIFLKVEAAIDGGVPLYGLSCHKDSAINWSSEYELRDMVKKDPDFELWESIKEGDMIRTGVTEDRGYVKCLARVGDAVMLSEEPLNRKQKDKLKSVASQLEELTGDDTESGVKRGVARVLEQLPKTTADAHRSASNHWWTVKELALQNWSLLRE